MPIMTTATKDPSWLTRIPWANQLARLDQVQAISPQALHKHSLKAIEEGIGKERIPIMLKFFPVAPQEQEHQEAPSGFIEERGQVIGIGAELPVEIVHPVDAYAQGEPIQGPIIYRQAKGFLVEEVPPAAYGLGQHHPWRDAIHELEQPQFLMPAGQPKAQ